MLISYCVYRLHNRQDEEWGSQVNIVCCDMRKWCAPEKVTLSTHLLFFFQTKKHAWADIPYLHMWQSWIEVRYCSVAYFERITEFDALLRLAFARG